MWSVSSKPALPADTQPEGGNYRCTCYTREANAFYSNKIEVRQDDGSFCLYTASQELLILHDKQKYEKYSERVPSEQTKIEKQTGSSDVAADRIRPRQIIRVKLRVRNVREYSISNKDISEG